jgi:hypothetical protein
LGDAVGAESNGRRETCRRGEYAAVPNGQSLFGAEGPPLFVFFSRYRGLAVSKAFEHDTGAIKMPGPVERMHPPFTVLVSKAACKGKAGTLSFPWDAYCAMALYLPPCFGCKCATRENSPFNSSNDEGFSLQKLENGSGVYGVTLIMELPSPPGSTSRDILQQSCWKSPEALAYPVLGKGEMLQLAPVGQKYGDK